MYEWRSKSRYRPYVKYLLGIGSIDFPNQTTYGHDTRVVFEPGGGMDVRFWNQFSVRGEYDYQFWHQLFGPHDLTPQGFTIGAVYDFGRRATN
jgi:opacity protein-like surface antigen